MGNWLKDRWGFGNKPKTGWSEVPKGDRKKTVIRAAIIAILAVVAGIIITVVVGGLNPLNPSSPVNSLLDPSSEWAKEYDLPPIEEVAEWTTPEGMVSDDSGKDGTGCNIYSKEDVDGDMDDPNCITLELVNYKGEEGMSKKAVLSAFSTNKHSSSVYTAETPQGKIYGDREMAELEYAFIGKDGTMIYAMFCHGIDGTDPEEDEIDELDGKMKAIMHSIKLK